MNDNVLTVVDMEWSDAIGLDFHCIHMPEWAQVFDSEFILVNPVFTDRKKDAAVQTSVLEDIPGNRLHRFDHSIGRSDTVHF